MSPSASSAGKAKAAAAASGKGKAAAASSSQATTAGKKNETPVARARVGGGKAKAATEAAVDVAPTPSKVEKATSDALQRRAERSNLIRTDREPDYEYPLLHASKELRQAASSRSIDVIKKPRAAAAKPRYLLLLPGRLAPMDGGSIGSIERLDTPNPEIYLDFPGKGKLRLRGTLVYPQSKYLTMQPTRGGETLVCDEAFDNLIVFSDAQWMEKVGGAASGKAAATAAKAEGEEGEEGGGEEDDGPLEAAPLPKSVHDRIHKKWSYAAGAASDHAGASGAAGPPARARGDGGSAAAGARGPARCRSAGERDECRERRRRRDGGGCDGRGRRGRGRQRRRSGRWPQLPTAHHQVVCGQGRERRLRRR